MKLGFLKNIPYKYGTRNILESDCYGAVHLAHATNGIELPKFEEWYQKHETDDDLDRETIVKISGIIDRYSRTPTEDATILVGISENRMFFGINSIGGGIFLTTPRMYTRIITYEKWKSFADNWAYFTPAEISAFESNIQDIL